jgi:hypothetical protein
MATVVACAVVGVGSVVATWSLDASSRKRGQPLQAAITGTGVLGGFALAFGGGIWALNMVRCPWCRADLLKLGVGDARPGGVRCCPYCTKMLDDEVPAAHRGATKTAKGKPAKAKPTKDGLWDDELA